MNTTINPSGPAVPQSSTSSAKPAAAGDAGSAAAGRAVANQPQAGDHVQLTESGRVLGGATRGTDSAAAAPLDARHVERIRQAIADGSYKVDASRVADRLIALEKQIG